MLHSSLVGRKVATSWLYSVVLGEHGDWQRTLRDAEDPHEQERIGKKLPVTCYSVSDDEIFNLFE